MPEAVEIDTVAGNIGGVCDPDWWRVVEEFARNFDERHERGASFCVVHHGVAVVDVWGGTGGNPARPWTRDTISVVSSATKGATALCVHILASRGELDLYAPVTAYWPAYGRNGKSTTTVAMLLNHSAGIPGFKDPVPPGAFADWEYMVRRIEDEAPWWEPGLRGGYHFWNFGWALGEIVRRVSGLSFADFFQKEVASPCGIDFWIGLPEPFADRVIDLDPFRPGEFWPATPSRFPELGKLAVANIGGYIDLDWATGRFGPNSALAHAAELPAMGGITNGRGLAKMYAPLATGGGDLVSADHVWRMSQVSMVSHPDAMHGVPTKFALGFMKAVDNRHLDGARSLLVGDRAFGHVGAGGTFGFADPDCGVSFGYTMNRMGSGTGLSARGQALVDAVYRTLGYRSSAGGVWAR